MSRRWQKWGMALGVLVLGAGLLAGCSGGDEAAVTLPTPAAPPAEGDNPALPGERLRLPAPDVRALAYAPDGEQVALSSGSAIWLTTRDLAALRALEGHTAAVRDLAWSPDGRLASAALDRTVRIWDPATGETLATLTGHDDWVMGVGWSPDGTRLVTGSSDGSVRLWEADGTPVTVLGATRVEQVNLQLDDADVFAALQDLEYSRLIVDRVEGEPLAGLAQRVHEAGYRLPVTLADSALADRLLALRAEGYTVRVETGDPDVQDELAALDQPALIELIDLLDDPAVDEAIQALNEAEAALAEIDAREDADLLRSVRQLRAQEVLIVIERADGETTTVPPEEDFVATLLDLRGEDFTLSLQVANQEELADKLRDPDFLNALEQLDSASAAVAAFNERDDARMIRLVRQLRAADDVTIRLETGDEALAADLAALDQTATVRLIELLQDEALLGALAPLAEAGYDLSRLPDHDTGAALRALAPLEPTVALQVGDEALAAEVGALDEAATLELIALVEDEVFLYMLGARDDAAGLLAELEAHEDFAFLEAMTEVGGPSGVEVRLSRPVGAERVTVARTVTREAFTLALVPQTEEAIQSLSAQDDRAIVRLIREMGPDALLQRIEAGDYALEPDLEADAQRVILERLAGDTFRIGVQREANGHAGGVSDVAWSPDGSAVVSAGADGTLRLWDPASGRLLTVLEHEDSLSALAWGPDPARFASASWDRTGVVWQRGEDGSEAEPAAEIDAGATRIQALAWSPDGAMLASGDRAGVLTIWDAATGDALGRAELGAEIQALAWSPDGASLLSGSRDGFVRQWSVEALLAGE